jgi:hypothetical protein
MPSRAVTVSTVSDDEDASSYTTNNTGTTEDETMDDSNINYNGTKQGGKNGVSSMIHAPPVTTSTTPPKDMTPTVTATVMAVADGVHGREIFHDEYHDDPLERHIRLGGAAPKDPSSATNAITAISSELFQSPEATVPVQDPFRDEEEEKEEEDDDDDDVVLVPMKKNNWTSSALQAFSSVMESASSVKNSNSQQIVQNSNPLLLDKDRRMDNNANSTPAFAMMIAGSTATAAESIPSHGKELQVDAQKYDQYYLYGDDDGDDNDLFRNDEEKKEDNFGFVDDDNFDDEIITMESYGSNKKVKKNKPKRKDSKKKKSKIKTEKDKKDPKITIVNYKDDNDDEETSHLRGSDDNSYIVDRFDDEDNDDGSHVHHKATSTRAPPKGHDHDLEAATGAATSLAMTFAESTDNHYGDRFVLDDDDIRDYFAAAIANDDESNNGYLSSDGVFLSKQRPSAHGGYPVNTTTRSLRESFHSVLSTVSPLHARPTASPSQEAWQGQEGFHDELVVFDTNNNGRRGDHAINSEEENSDSDEEESVFVKAINSSHHPNYRRSLFLGKQSRCCWCLVILIFLIFLAMLIPLAMLSHDKRQSTKAQDQAEPQQPVFSTGDDTPPPTVVATNATDAPTETPSCVDEIKLNHNQTCFNTSTPISFSFTHCNPSAFDWIALYPSNSVYYDRLWKDDINWIWVSTLSIELMPHRSTDCFLSQSSSGGLTPLVYFWKSGLWQSPLHRRAIGRRCSTTRYLFSPCHVPW